jgi:hypothetical protein
MKKLYKIKYTLNILPSVMFKKDVCMGANTLMETLGESLEQTIFETKIIEDFYDFQWNSYAKHLHMYGAIVHFVYVFLFVFYVSQVYLDRNFDNRVTLNWVMFTLLVHPFLYDGLQAWKQGLDYLRDPWNYIDQGYIWFGFATILFQRFEPDILDPVC